jgi:hypothetical protein
VPPFDLQKVPRRLDGTFDQLDATLPYVPRTNQRLA